MSKTVSNKITQCFQLHCLHRHVILYRMVCQDFHEKCCQEAAKNNIAVVHAQADCAAWKIVILTIIIKVSRFRKKAG